jgi:hypothetical protein
VSFDISFTGEFAVISRRFPDVKHVFNMLVTG